MTPSAASGQGPASGTGALIALRSVSFRWSARQPPCLAIDRLDIGAGERLMLLGPSGSGKSTLLGLLGGVLVAQSGTVSLFGEELGALSAGARDRLRVDHIGFIFQLFNLVPYLTTRQNVLLPCRFSRRRADRAAGSPEAESERLLAALGIGEACWDRPVTALSVGQQQRVAAARALIGRPELIIADEPTSALDALSQQAFLALLQSQARASGATLLFVSHDPRLADGFDRCLEIGAINRAGPGG